MLSEFMEAASLCSDSKLIEDEQTRTHSCFYFKMTAGSVCRWLLSILSFQNPHSLAFLTSDGLSYFSQQHASTNKTT